MARSVQEARREIENRFGGDPGISGFGGGSSKGEAIVVYLVHRDEKLEQKIVIAAAPHKVIFEEIGEVTAED